MYGCRVRERHYDNDKHFTVNKNITPKRTEDDILNMIDKFCYNGIKKKQLSKLVHVAMKKGSVGFTISRNGTVSNYR